MAESKIQNNIFQDTGAIITLNSTGTSMFEITLNKSYRLGNVMYLYLVLHKIGTLQTYVEYTIGSINANLKNNAVLPCHTGASAFLFTTHEVMIVVQDGSRNWFNFSGSFLIN